MNRRHLWICLVTVVALALIVLFLKQNRLKERAESRSCASTITSLGLAARIWASDNNGIAPNDFMSMSNEINATKILVCPADPNRQQAINWAALSPESCSYEILAPGLRDSETNTPFIRCKIHAHLGYLDGTVFDGSRRRGKFD
jgi:hypothetical protein